ncbi:MAG: leucine-rich repeat domain-containing protein [Treponemataceae bacterium]|nr:leucine-rich repeat domain-containing protein [Treponemataceae bacterium]
MKQYKRTRYTKTYFDKVPNLGKVCFELPPEALDYLDEIEQSLVDIDSFYQHFFSKEGFLEGLTVRLFTKSLMRKAGDFNSSGPKIQIFDCISSIIDESFSLILVHELAHFLDWKINPDYSSSIHDSTENKIARLFETYFDREPMGNGKNITEKFACAIEELYGINFKINELLLRTKLSDYVYVKKSVYEKFIAPVTKSYLDGKNLSEKDFDFGTKYLSQSPEPVVTESEIIISENISEIEPYQFKKLNKVESVRIEGKDTIIDWRAFINCDKLSKIEICPGQKHYIIENGTVYSPDKKILYYRLRTLKDPFFCVPDSVEIIKRNSMRYNESLEELHIGDGVKIIERKAVFGNCNLKKITGCNNVQIIRMGAFGFNSSLETIEGLQNLKILGPYAFACCKKLKNIQFSDKLKSFLDNSFINCQDLVGRRVKDTELTEELTDKKNRLIAGFELAFYD